MPAHFDFHLRARDGRARAGVFYTPHGEILTPVFAPVGTQATIKAVTPQQLEDIGVGLILANAYHLYLRPRDELVAELGGLHEFMNWPGPLLTDSGGYQVFSLADINQIDDDGVNFKSHLDGSIHRFTPELAIEIQERLGADIIMAFDECPEPYDQAYNVRAVERTHIWAERCLQAKTRSDQALFGILQGGVFPDLRIRSAEFIASLGFAGHAIGGLSVGETRSEMLQILDLVDPVLPDDKPRYLMGVGTPQDLVHGVMRGIDIFDCVLPTRLARNDAVFSRAGDRLNLRNAPFAKDERPIDEQCACYTCRNFSRAYLRHLIIAKEMLSATLLSIHNIFTLVHLAQEMHQAILDHTFEDLAAEILKP